MQNTIENAARGGGKLACVYACVCVCLLFVCRRVPLQHKCINLLVKS